MAPREAAVEEADPPISLEKRWCDVIAEGATDEQEEIMRQQMRGVNTSDYEASEVDYVVDSAGRVKECGNDLLAETPMAALNHYLAGLKLLHKVHIYSTAKMMMCPLEQIAPAKRPTWQVWEKAKMTALALLLNISQAYLNLGRNQDAMDSATAALQVMQGKSSKALYRRAAAKSRMEGWIDSAVDDLRAAAKLDPQNRGIRAELARVKALQKSQESARPAESKKSAFSTFLKDKTSEDSAGPASEKSAASKASKSSSGMAGWAERAAAAHRRKDDAAFASENRARLEKGEKELTRAEWEEKDVARQAQEQRDEEFMKKYDTPEFMRSVNELGNVMNQLDRSGGALPQL